MKIEPQKTKKIPKYAAALAVLATAAVLTGCSKTEPGPDIAGDMVVMTDTIDQQTAPASDSDAD